MITTLEDLKTYYANRLITQYRTKTKAKATIQALVQESWLDGLIQAEAVCFDLDTATGAQLDVLGRIVGVPRNIYGLDLEHIFFEFTDYNNSISGVDMQRYSDSIDGPEIMLRYRSDAVYTLTDFEMRTLIKLKIIFNTVSRTTKALIESLFLLFGTSVVVVDNQDMTMDYTISQPYYNVFLVAEYLSIIPKPMAVEAIVTYV
jgi:Protein of unknown function (DUF2612)